jgi:protein SHQ1
MIPRFKLTQDDDWLYVEVNVPYVRVSEMDFRILGCEFSFYCKPYLLKLTFPHPLVDDDRAKAVYDVDKVWRTGKWED